MGSADRLCFGTSTFVAGRLRSDKDSAPGIATLRAAIESGVRLVHSNPKLGTQWAIRHVTDQAGSVAPVRHLIKAEAPLDGGPCVLITNVIRALAASRVLLGVDRVHAVVLEIDIKGTRQSDLLTDPCAAESFYQVGAQAALAAGGVELAYAYCHYPAHVTGALACPDIAGIAALYHRAAPWPAVHLAEITATGRAFVGMAPLNRGRLPDPDDALRWALADRRVSAVTLTMSSVEHLDAALRAARHVELYDDYPQLPDQRVLRPH